MPKMKTKSGAKKRFKITGTKKITKRGAFQSHLMEKKSSAAKRGFKVASELAKGDLKNVKKMLGL